MRSAIAHRHPEPLRVADDHVGPELARWRQQRQGEQIAAHRHQRAGRVDAIDQLADRHDRTVLRRVLEQHPEDSVVYRHGGRVPHLDLDAERGGASGHDVDRLRETAASDQQTVGAGRRARPEAMQHRRRLGRRGRLVEQRGIGNRHPGQIGDRCLEVEQRLEPALRHLRLIGGVGRVPPGILEDVAQDDARRNAAVVA